MASLPTTTHRQLHYLLKLNILIFYAVYSTKLKYIEHQLQKPMNKKLIPRLFNNSVSTAAQNNLGRL
jgi:hypothetical protein